MEHDRFFVVTGGPGAGKTTLIDALKAAGFAAAPEAGRAVIQDQSAIGGHGLPWKDPMLFAELNLSWDLRSRRDAMSASGPVFFDRGVVDMVGYCRLTGLPVPGHFRAAAERMRYHRRVFAAPPWPEIFAQDAERRQDFDEAVRTYDRIVEAYREFGYEIVPLPKASVGQRLRFVLDVTGLRPGPLGGVPPFG